MDWNQEIVSSLLWLLKAYGIALLGACVVGALLMRLTRWGRQFNRLARPYFAPARSWRPLLAVALLLLLALAAVRMSVLFSNWYKAFYDALQDKNQAAFWSAIVLFLILATLHITRELIAFYAQQSFEIHWRTWLNEHVLDDWLAGSAYYRGQFLQEPIDNPDQRVQVDIDAFVRFSVSLAVGTVRSLVSLVEFTIMLWGLSGVLVLMGIEIPHGMVYLVYGYVLIASILAFKIGRPLIRLNFLSEKLGANYRYALMRFREYSESIAFFRGETVERSVLRTRFGALIANIWALVFRNILFKGFNFTVGQAAVIFPYVIQAKRFFEGEIKLGDVMQTGSAFNEVEGALSFFRTAYDDFAQYRAVLDRLTSFADANQFARSLPVVKTAAASGLVLKDLQVRRPDQEIMIKGLDLSVSAGESLLIKGASGSGKTTLLRTLASLWPYAEGSVGRPLGQQALFLSQRPYLPLGTLRAALTYPAPEASDQALADALQKVHLAQLQDRLNQEADWSRILSLGEQQRLAFARVLINRPDIAFLDEATSATDEGLEYTLYELLRRELPQCILVSVGHRSTLAQFHQYTLELGGLSMSGLWSMQSSLKPSS